ncbi:hypothetical protein M431DRAFT_357706 [Trichoderma harzianum CBS 226.95]|uniref:Uncharacterized protein n=1 Tax=Trichoderma harzianum CBS 226.95 TaxID=983964 RepID=A0A2T4ALY0_TRIHA|nr:hypothetical protein M431DRAFT_357706 [Trichoderma harzianum CBS 226.95]PTB58080.1 hypothetical protein M431DRAFT_357706 [Trichoderma harzianum CBS 226.95]
MGRRDEVKPILSAESLAGCFGDGVGVYNVPEVQLCCGRPGRCCTAQCHAVPDGLSEVAACSAYEYTVAPLNLSTAVIDYGFQLYCNRHLNLNLQSQPRTIQPSQHTRRLPKLRPLPSSFSPGNPVSVPSQISPKISRLRQLLRSSAPRRYTRFRCIPCSNATSLKSAAPAWLSDR